MAIVVSKLDPKFKYDVAAEPGGENIKYCFSCGVCTASCPVSEVYPDYNPRKIIRMVLLGMREQVLSSDLIWYCALCYKCQAHCPQNVKITDIMDALRTMAVKEGYVHPSFSKQVEAIDTFTQELRRKMLASIVGKKGDEISVDPAKLLAEESKG